MAVPSGTCTSKPPLPGSRGAPELLRVPRRAAFSTAWDSRSCSSRHPRLAASESGVSPLGFAAYSSRVGAGRSRWVGMIGSDAKMGGSTGVVLYAVANGNRFCPACLARDAAAPPCSALCTAKPTG